MTDRPIIFSAPMALALLAGRKSMTRRVLKPQPNPAWGLVDLQRAAALSACRYAPGDRLWVREALDLGSMAYPIGHATYAADGADVDLRPDGAADWAGGYKRRSVPSIHMPRWASRLTLTVTDVRVQRVQEISEEDAIAEGLSEAEDEGGGELYWSHRDDYPIPPADCFHYPVEAFRALWNSIHGPAAWAANPWVAAYSFSTEQRNIDA